jgi:hypothetical protein
MYYEKMKKWKKVKLYKNGSDHKLEKINGIPEHYFKYKRRCAYCDETFIIDQEKNDKEIRDYFNQLRSKQNEIYGE